MGRKNVTFSKRKAVIFKRASELCTLCGAEFAIIAFSPGNQVFSFGHPSVESVVEHFLYPKYAATTGNSDVQLANLPELNELLEEMLDRVEAERRRGEELRRRIRESQRGIRLWEAPIRDLDLDELERLKDAMEKLRIQVYEERELRLIAEEEAAAGYRLPLDCPPVAPPGHRGGDGGAPGPSGGGGGIYSYGAL